MRSWMQHSTRRAAGLTALLMVSTQPAFGPISSAWAQPGQSSSSPPFSAQCHARAMYLNVDELHGGKQDVIAHANQTVFVTFEPGIKLKWAGMTHPDFSLRPIGNDLEIYPKPSAAVGTVASVTVKTDRFPLKLKLLVSSDPLQATHYLYVAARSREEFCAEVLKAPMERLAASEAREAELDAELRDATARCGERARRDAQFAKLQYALQRGRRFYAVPDTTRQNAGSVGARLTELEFMARKQGTLVFFEIDNRELTDIPLTDLRVSNKSIKDRPIEVAVFDVPQPRDDEHIAVIPRKSRARGVVLLPSELESSIEPLSIAFQTPNGIGPVIAAARTWKPYPAVDREFLERVLREEQVRREQEQRAKQASVSARMVTGAFFVADDAGRDDLDSVLMTGLAVRLQKGYANGLALYGEITGGRTGEAAFADVMLEGAQGRLSRKATFGRLHFGGAVRFGDQYVKTARFGMGLQGVRHESQLAPTDGGAPPDLDPTTDFEGILALSLEIERRLGSNVFLGLTASTVLSAFESGNGVRTIEAGVHIGYGWNSPGDEPASE